MTITTPFHCLVNRLGQMVLKEASDPSPQAHFELLRIIDQLRSAVETPTETVLRLIYQVRRSTNLNRVRILTGHSSLLKMPRCALSLIWVFSPCLWTSDTEGWDYQPASWQTIPAPRKI